MVSIYRDKTGKKKKKGGERRRRRRRRRTATTSAAITRNNNNNNNNNNDNNNIFPQLTCRPQSSGKSLSLPSALKFEAFKGSSFCHTIPYCSDLISIGVVLKVWSDPMQCFIFTAWQIQISKSSPESRICLWPKAENITNAKADRTKEVVDGSASQKNDYL